jgi:hypothetical protein
MHWIRRLVAFSTANWQLLRPETLHVGCRAEKSPSTLVTARAAIRLSSRKCRLNMTASAGRERVDICEGSP